MSNIDLRSEAKSASGSLTFGVLLFIGVGFIFGAGIEGDRKEQATMAWAAKAAEECEATYETDGYANVSDCLAGAIEQAESEKQQEAEPYDPRG